MMRLALLLCVIGGAAHAEPKPPAHYAKLFQQDHVITYDVTFTTWDYAKVEEMQRKNIPSKRWPRKSDRSVVTCKVARVVKFTSAIVSEVTCSEDLRPALHLEGIFMATAKGLSRIGEFPAKESDLAITPDLDLEIAASPKVSRVVKKVEMDATSTVGVRITNGSWCSYGELAGGSHGHNGASYTCFGRGVISESFSDWGPELKMWKVRAR